MSRTRPSANLTTNLYIHVYGKPSMQNVLDRPYIRYYSRAGKDILCIDIDRCDTVVWSEGNAPLSRHVELQISTTDVVLKLDGEIKYSGPHGIRGAKAIRVRLLGGNKRQDAAPSEARFDFVRIGQ